jgi:hypothetical protein
MHIFGLGGQADADSLELYTKRRTRILNAQSKEVHPDLMRERANVLTNAYRVRFRSHSATYNCFGMVFANRRTAIVDGTEVEKILQDDGYHCVCRRSDAAIGDVILYRKAPKGEIAHVGIITKIDHDLKEGYISFEVLSQWGSNGEVFHPEDVVPPLFGNVREIWSERRLP